MTINLSEIYTGLKAYRHERGLTAENQKAGYIVNVMEEMGELAKALRCYERIKEHLSKDRDGMCGYHHHKYNLMLIDAEHEIIDAICDIAVYTINAGADIVKENYLTHFADCNYFNFTDLVMICGDFANEYSTDTYQHALLVWAMLCEKYGYNFEIAMIETIKEISSRTGKYDESAKKWVKDESDEAKSKWYKANFEKARIEK